NQIAVGVHARPGDEVVCDPTAHVYLWEGGGIARLWGVTPRTIEPSQGLLTLADLQGKIRPNDPHYVHTRMISLENTHNRAGGRVRQGGRRPTPRRRGAGECARAADAPGVHSPRRLARGGRPGGRHPPRAGRAGPRLNGAADRRCVVGRDWLGKGAGEGRG